MIDLRIEEESLLNSANIAAEALRRKAIRSAAELDDLANGSPDPEAGPAKDLLSKAAAEAGMLVNEATMAAKELLASAAVLAANSKDSLMMQVIMEAQEADVLFAKAAELIEVQKISLLLKAESAAKALESRAVEDALSLINVAQHAPHASMGVAKDLIDNATESAKALLNEASKDAELLLAEAADTAKSLLSRDQQIEEELLKLRKLASVAILAGGIAHDFNNILTGVFGNLEMAKLNLPPAHVAYQYILTANQSMERATNLTRQLLTFAKGGEPLLEIMDIRSIIYESVRLSLSVSGVKVTLALEDDLWMINADKGQLSQVITNLIINADQAMPEGGTLTIEASNIEELADDFRPHLSGSFICIKIIDDGVGISKEQQKTIFDPYFTTKEAGSGLGLATTQSIITKHNGRVSVKSDLGKGATFSIYLPATSEAQIVDELLLNNKKSLAQYSGYILFMDDEEAILDVSVRMLKSLGYSVETAIDGEQAIEKYINADRSGRPFDLVIMDLSVPNGMGGEKAVKELLGINPEVKVIVSSGYSNGNVLSNYADYGFKGRITKPYRMKTLESELFKVLN
ncbi:MAG: signal transduction histidine kinase/ActR/RegA family two-component response regulator [Candidatus Azotimanducaceae bacterium]|jgi:signal transduction histidine kinase/ActR/RegA family two-component response regulator